MTLFSDTTGAEFSPCRRYRYALWRIWDKAKPPCLFIMLNPSTADEVDNDPTVERCERRASDMGYGGLLVRNIFAFRSTDPQALYSESDPVGPDNDAAILDAIRQCGVIVCGWGAHGKLHGRGEAVRRLILDAGRQPHYLQLNLDGTPRHPLYVAYAKKPTPWSQT